MTTRDDRIEKTKLQLTDLNPRMFHRWLLNGVALIVLGSASLTSVAGDSPDAVVQSAGNVTYVSGGVGTESLDRLGAMARDFNLKLVFALKSGDYLSDVQVKIADAKGKTLLDTTADGPWFMARLPQGSYRVVASLAGKAQARQVAITTAGFRTIDFRWDAD